MFRLLSLGTLAVAFALSTSFASADEKAATAKTYAVVVGVGSFGDHDIKARPTADADAKAIYSLLTNKEIGSVPAENIALLLSKPDAALSAQEGTKANILKAIGTIAGKATKDDTILVYLVMQGASATEKPCLFATDSTFKDRTKNAVFASEIEKELQGLKSEQVCVFLDLNMKAFESKETVLAANVNELVRVFMGLKEKDAEQEPPIGRVVILNGNGNQPSLEIGKNGIFTTAVIDALKGKADSEGYEPDGNVTVEETHKYVEKAIEDLSRTVAKSNEEKAQRLVYIGRPLHFVLTHNPAAPSISLVKKFNEKTGQLEPVAVEEGKKLLEQMPRLKAMQEMRKVYQKYAEGNINPDQLKTQREQILNGMKISDSDAKTFTGKVFDGLSMIRGNYIKKLNMGEMVANGVRGMYRYSEIPVPETVKEKLNKAKDLSDSDIKELLTEARLPLGKREDLEKDKDVDIAINASIRKFVDDYTTYTSKEKGDEMKKEIDGRFTGIGVQIRRDIARDGLIVVTPILNSPAYKAGLLAGDLITEIIRDQDGEGKALNPPQVTSTKGMETTDAVKLILGLPGTKVKLKIDREGEKEPLIKELTRGVVQVESVYGFKRNEKDDSWDYYIDPKNKIAYMHLTQFARGSFIDMKKAVEQMQKEGVKGLILDLRFNPGGFLDVAVDICDMFVDDGVIVSVRPGNVRTNERVLRGRHENSFLDFPMVCLVNEGSASGSEILSACLQDHGRAVVMGERSFGKGSVQNVEQFRPTGGTIKLTTATFWPPSARNLNKASTGGKDEEDWGVRPDSSFEMKLERAEKDELFEKLYNWGVIPRRDLPPKEDANKKKEFKDRQLEMALKYLQGQLNVSRAEMK
jgi:carboxyl-terminal processing protease